MKHPIIAFLFCFGLLHSLAADEPLIPAALNAVLPKIHVGMTIREVEAALAPAYPKVKGQMGIWSGQTGYIDYKLDERHTLSGRRNFYSVKVENYFWGRSAGFMLR